MATAKASYQHRNTGGLLARTRLPLVAALAAAFMLTGCGVHGLNFVKDTRVDIVTPHDRSKVVLPLTVRWRAHDFAGTYAVFVDRSPQPPGHTLDWPFRNDLTCKSAGGKQLCASDGFLAAHGVHTTTDSSFAVVRVPRLTGNERSRQFHEITVVLLDAQGRRRGEGAWSVEFEVPKT